MSDDCPYYINKLILELELRKERNSQYSLRSFARDLDINSGTLTRILQLKRIPSLKLGQQLVVSLKLKDKETSHFLNSLAEEKWKSSLSRVPKDLKKFGSPQSKGTIKNELRIELEKYRALSDWIHYALLELTYVHDFKYNFSWMARRLNRSVSDVQAAVQRLIDLNLLEEKNKTLIKTKERITTKDKTQTTKPLRKLQKDLLIKAIDNLEQTDIEKRVASSMTMAVNLNNIEKARALISVFLSEMCELLEEGEQNEVYNLIVNLSPASSILNTKTGEV